MRESTKILKIKETKTVITETQAASEDLHIITENKSERTVDVYILYKDAAGNPIRTDQVIIEDQYYDMLMSANPPYAPKKPENEYREEDIWHVIELINANR